MRVDLPISHERVPTFHKTASVYVLPNDTPEHMRLAEQHEAIMALTRGRLPHAPVSSPKLILEVGCGTGAVTRMLAEKYPDAEVIGIDLSPVPPQPVDSELLNLKFKQVDFSELVKTDERFGANGSGQVDFLFSRLLIFGITDWPGYIRAIYGALKPGGWAELQEIQQDWEYDDPALMSPRPSECWEWLKLIRGGTTGRGLDPDCFDHIPGHMEKQHFTDIVRRDYRLEYDEEKYNNPNEPSRRWVDMLIGDKWGLFWHMIPRIIQTTNGDTSPERIRQLRVQMLEGIHVENNTAGKHSKWTVTVGRKPVHQEGQ